MNRMKKLGRLAEIIESSSDIALFSGAGMSVPSGIPDFRSEGGLYKSSRGSYSAEYMLSHSFFMARPEDFFEFYKTKMIYPDAEPNAAHHYFAGLESAGRLKATVTQNIDGLHQKAGARRVFELHGSVHRNYCMRCGKKFGLGHMFSSSGVPVCDECGGIVRPDVVLYEEGLCESVVRGAVDAIASADTLIVVGTSLVVYPAAGLIDYFHGSNLVLINKGATAYDNCADLIINEDISEVVLNLPIIDN